MIKSVADELQAADILLTSGSVVCDDIDGNRRYRLSRYAVYEKKIAEDIERIFLGEREAFDVNAVKEAILDVVDKRSKGIRKQLVLEEKQMEAIEVICEL